MHERQAPGEPGPGRQIEAVTGAWLPGATTAGATTAGATTAGIGEAGIGKAGIGEAGTAPAGTATARTGGGPEFLINLGTSHPSAHGMLRLRLTLDGDRISVAEPEIGFMHRGAEKLFEARDYRQIIVLANRHDWLGAFASELGVVLAAERLAGIEVPPRAVWARTMLAELNRALSHLAFLSSYPPEIAAAAGEPGAPRDPGEPRDPGRSRDPAKPRGPGEPNDAGEPAAARAAFGAREAIQSVMEEISGGRMHYMFNRVGGLKEEIPAGWLARACRVIDEVRAALPTIGATLGQDGFRDRTRGIGVLTPAQVRQYGISGPAARACGVDFDLRRDEPYLAYAELAGVLKVPVRTEGDCLARFECLRDQLAVSLDLAQECAGRLASLPQGPLSARLPKVFKVPEGHAYAWTEGPLGLSGYYLVSRGGKTPWRLKLRSASFSNMAVLPDLLPGHRVGDLAAVLGSLFFVVGDMDR
jgi:NADH-quinone oxidoreductase subunit D